MKGWRTIIFNTVAGLIAAFELLAPVLMTPEFSGLIPREWMPLYVLIVTVGNVYLRKITTTPMGKPE